MLREDTRILKIKSFALRKEKGKRNEGELRGGNSSILGETEIPSNFTYHPLVEISASLTVRCQKTTSVES